MATPASPWRREYSKVLTNPPFGKKQSLLFVNEEGDTILVWVLERADGVGV